MKVPKNVAASVNARLLARARATGDDFQLLLTRYCFERFLYRLSVSGRGDRFVLKGAMLLALWSEQPWRSTHDLDLLRRGSPDHEAVRADLEAILSTNVPPDGVRFAREEIRIEDIRIDDDDSGVRAMIPAFVGKARVTLRVDMGHGDAVWPAPENATYPTLLDFDAPRLLTYPRPAVVAEKLEAIVVLGDRNSRIKDYFDLYHLAESFEFDRETLAEAVRRTFARRGTPLPDDLPIGLSGAWWDNPSRGAQVRAFARRARIDLPVDLADRCTRTLQAFLGPVLADLHQGRRVAGTWPPGGPWRKEKVR